MTGGSLLVTVTVLLNQNCFAVIIFIFILPSFHRLITFDNCFLISVKQI